MENERSVVNGGTFDIKDPQDELECCGTSDNH